MKTKIRTKPRIKAKPIPPKSTVFALVGSGRLARHLGFYLRSLKAQVLLWSRNGDPRFNTHHKAPDRNPPGQNLKDLRKVVEHSTHVLFAVRDDAVAELSRPFWKEGKTLVHFSGALQLRHVRAAHPLMTFGAELEPLPWYRKIPFVVDDGVAFSDLLPGLPNPSWCLRSEQRALYHALCSLAGNASFLLWTKIGDEFEDSLGLPRDLISPLLRQVVANSKPGLLANFTGPVARGDWKTVRDHLKALNSRPALLRAYRGYLEFANSQGHLVPEALL